LATNGVDKPILNLFRMLGLMQGNRVKAISSATVGIDKILQFGVREGVDIDAIAARSDRNITVLTWSYHDDEVAASDSQVQLNVAGVPDPVHRVLLTHYRIDRDHSNAYTVWKEMGSPQAPTPEQYARLKAAGKLELFESPRWVDARNGRLGMSFSLPRQSLSLIVLSW
jgi:xylan 1,4-beta-xylosidase